MLREVTVAQRAGGRRLSVSAPIAAADIATSTAVKLSTCGYWKGALLQSAELLGKLMGSRFSALPS